MRYWCAEPGHPGELNPAIPVQSVNKLTASTRRFVIFPVFLYYVAGRVPPCSRSGRLRGGSG